MVINSVSGHITKCSARELVKKYFIEELQGNLNITYVRMCSNDNCSSSFKLSSSKILFDFENNTLHNFSPSSEILTITNNDLIYRFITSYQTRTTHLEYEAKQQNGIQPVIKKIDMNMEQYIKYPMNREFLFKKIKTLLLFS